MSDLLWHSYLGGVETDQVKGLQAVVLDTAVENGDKGPGQAGLADCGFRAAAPLPQPSPQQLADEGAPEGGMPSTLLN